MLGRFLSKTMLSYEKLARKPKIFRSFTGFDVQEFDFLSQKVESEYKYAEKELLSKRKRKWGIGAGHPFSLSVKNRMVQKRQPLLKSCRDTFQN